MGSNPTPSADRAKSRTTSGLAAYRPSAEIAGRTLWYRPLFIACFAFVLVGTLLEEAGHGEIIEALGMVLGLVLFALFAWWLVRRFVRHDEPPLTLAERMGERPAPLDERRLDRFADALERERQVPQARYSDRR